MCNKKIYNPVTGKYYEVKQRPDEERTEQTRRLWKPPKKRRKKTIWDII